jgi:hypothetical protein
MAVDRWLVLLLAFSAAAMAAGKKHQRCRIGGVVGGQVVEKPRRRLVADSDAGTVTAVDVTDAEGTAYRLHFITMDPGALFLPVQLHADMVFYVDSGRCHAYVGLSVPILIRTTQDAACIDLWNIQGGVRWKDYLHRRREQRTEFP